MPCTDQMTWRASENPSLMPINQIPSQSHSPQRIISGDFFWVLYKDTPRDLNPSYEPLELLGVLGSFTNSLPSDPSGLVRIRKFGMSPNAAQFGNDTAKGLPRPRLSATLPLIPEVTFLLAVCLS